MYHLRAFWAVYSGFGPLLGPPKYVNFKSLVGCFEWLWVIFLQTFGGPGTSLGKLFLAPSPVALTSLDVTGLGPFLLQGAPVDLPRAH